MGFKFKARDDWQDFVDAPVAPANYKDPDKITQYVADKTEQLQRDAANDIRTSVLEEAVALVEGQSGKVVGQQRFTTGAGVLEYIESLDTRNVTVVAVDTVDALRRCAWDSIRSTTELQVPGWITDMNINSNAMPDGAPTLINLWRMSGAKATGVPVHTWLTIWLKCAVPVNVLDYPEQTATLLRQASNLVEARSLSYA
jgi:hypothetical protein